MLGFFQGPVGECKVQTCNAGFPMALAFFTVDLVWLLAIFDK